ncbi:hypothetical protein ACWGII_30815 [Streptomyces sp. NPDC054855]
MGRRYQLAYELIQQVDWLSRCAVRPIAWVVKDVADAGWTAEEVRGWLHVRGGASQVRRASGLLAVLLKGAETVLDTPKKRTDAVARWRHAQEVSRQWHIEEVRDRREQAAHPCQSPSNRDVQRHVKDAFEQVRRTAGLRLRGSAPLVVEEPCLREVVGEDELRELLEVTWGELMMGETSRVTYAVDAMGRSWAEDVFGAELVQRGLNLACMTSLTEVGSG